MSRLVLESLILILVALNSDRTPELGDAIDQHIDILRAVLRTWDSADDEEPG